MKKTNKFTPKDLDPAVLDQVLQSLSDYYISKRRLKVHETTLGKGGFGTVKLAELWPNVWIQFGGTPTTVAVKELRTENHDGVPLRTAARLAREIKVWASCNHENILEFTGYYLSKDFKKAYLVSPYMTNGNIKEYLSREAPSQEQRLELVCGTIKGLAYLHSRNPSVVHGDLKSLNVLVNNTGKPLLSDFGLAKAMESKPTGLSTSNSFKGTIRYTGPEVLNGSPRDCPSDIWAWGCLVLEIITGNPPYHECQTETQVLILICGHRDHRRTPEPSDTSSLPMTALALLKRCWRFEPGRRPDAQQCLQRVENILWLLSLGLPQHSFIPSTRFDFSVWPSNSTNVADIDGTMTARLLIPDTYATVKVEIISTSDRDCLKTAVEAFNRQRKLTHKNLLEVTGYSMGFDLETFVTVWSYTGQQTLLEYLAHRNKRLASGARFKLLQDMVKGLAYLHSSSVNMALCVLNPWNVFVNTKGEAVLSLIGMAGQRQIRKDRDRELVGPPVHLWVDPLARHMNNFNSKSGIWSWACIVLQVMCEIRQFDRASIHGRTFMKSTRHSRHPEPYLPPILPARLLGLVRQCWHLDPDERPSASDCLDILDLVIQEGWT